jgi:mRNA interferase RelE/StbE
MYRVEFSKLARDKFNRLDKPIQKRIVKKLREISSGDPYRYFEPLRGVSARKARVGDYRVIADVDRKNRAIHVLTLGHRSEIYRKLPESGF